MKIFLTGASGFVGRNLAKQLLKNGHTVTAAVRATSDISHIPVGCEIVTVDFASSESICCHLNEVEVVYHVAGAVKARSGEDFDRINAGLTAAVVNAVTIQSPEALFILASSQAAAGPNDGGPQSSYGRSKLLAEQVVTGLSRYIIVRSPAALGPDDGETQSFYVWARRGITVTLGNSDVKFCVISISDLSFFMAMLADVPEAVGRVLQPSCPKLVTWKKIHKAMEKATGRRILRIPVPSFLVYAAGFLAETMATLTGSRLLLDREKARDITSSKWLCKQHEVEKITGWKPELSFEETIRRAVQTPEQQ